MARTVSFFPPPAPVRFEPPGRGELIVLGALSLACLATAFFLPRSLSEYGLLEKTVVMCNVGVWAAMLHACYLRWVVSRRRDARPGLPGEGVLLGAMLLICIAFAFTMAPEAQAGDGPAAQVRSTDDKTSKAAGEFAVRLVKTRGLFKPTAPSWIASSPRVDGGDRVCDRTRRCGNDADQKIDGRGGPSRRPGRPSGTPRACRPGCRRVFLVVQLVHVRDTQVAVLEGSMGNVFTPRWGADTVNNGAACAAAREQDEAFRVVLPKAFGDFAGARFVGVPLDGVRSALAWTRAAWGCAAFFFLVIAMVPRFERWLDQRAQRPAAEQM